MSNSLTSPIKKISIVLASIPFFLACTDPIFKNDYIDNSPTSGQLKVYCEEGLLLHVENQAYTFMGQYPKASIETIAVSETQAIDAFYKDSCKAMVITRELNANELKAFASKQMNPAHSKVAYTGLALVTNKKTGLSKLTYEQLLQGLSNTFSVTDSLNQTHPLYFIFDSPNSAIIHYVQDSILKTKQLSANTRALKKTMDVLNLVRKNPYSVGLIDFAWLSDADDSLYKVLESSIDFVAVTKPNSSLYVKPSQSSFKTGEYPFIRHIYVYRRTDDFSLAKGFETFVAGPKGQMTFLKQGLLPNQQQERNIHVNLEPFNSQ